MLTTAVSFSVFLTNLVSIRSASMAATANLRQMQRLQEYARTPENINCVDCGYSPSTWASINLNVFVCMSCSGIHRMLGVHITQVRSILFSCSISLAKSVYVLIACLPLHFTKNALYFATLFQIRSLTLDKWQEAWVLGMFKMNNAKFNSYYEAKLPPSHKLSPSADDATRTAYIRAKYERKMFYGDPSERNASPVEHTLSVEQRSMTPRTLRRMQRRAEREVSNDNTTSLPIAALPLSPVSPASPATTASSFDIFSVNQATTPSSHTDPIVDIFGNMQISSSKVSEAPVKKPHNGLFSNMTLTTSSSANKALNVTSSEDKGAFVTTSHGSVFVKPKSSGFDINTFDFTAVPSTPASTPASTPVAPVVASASVTSNHFDIFNLGSISSAKTTDMASVSVSHFAPQSLTSSNMTTRAVAPKVNIFNGITIKSGTPSLAVHTSPTSDTASMANLTESQLVTDKAFSTNKINGKFITDASGRQVFVRDTSNSWLDSYSEPNVHYTPIAPVADATASSVFEHFESSKPTPPLPATSDFEFLNENRDEEGSAFDFIREEPRDYIEEEDPFAGLPGATDFEPATIEMYGETELSSSEESSYTQVNLLSTPTFFEKNASSIASDTQEEPSVFGTLLDENSIFNLGDDDNTRLEPDSEVLESRRATENFATRPDATDKFSTFDNLLDDTPTAAIVEDAEEEPSAFGNLLGDDLSNTTPDQDDNDAFLRNYASVFEDDEAPLPSIGVPEDSRGAVVEDFDEDSLWNGGLLDD